MRRPCRFEADGDAGKEPVEPQVEEPLAAFGRGRQRREAGEVGALAAALSQLPVERSGIGSAVVQAFQKTAGPFGTAIAGSVLAATYQAHLDLGGLSATASTTVGQSVYDGLAVADRLGSASLAHSPGE